MPSVYLSTIYSLFDLGNTQKGHISQSAGLEKLSMLMNQRVLIHSASGGVGIASFHLCQYIGAEVNNSKSLQTSTDCFRSSQLSALKKSDDS